ncbi:metallophosphoesterase [Afifella aestuarii]|uniref:metallophosphoesterase n=1 Tax=Afifella aestuarii TaxID=1909496 RepID=UPI000FE423B3|nr:metallophosphoesterase [Afifella aestuarii]
MIIAQISDIHAAPDNDNMTRFARALSWLDGLDLDALVMSGDLIEDGSSEEYREIAARLGALRCPVLLLPGNSDDRSAMRAVFSDRPGSVARGDAMHFVAEIGGVRLVGIDTTLNDTSAGDVAPHLTWVEEVLDAPGADASLVFSHHHLFASGIAPMDAVMAQGASEFGDLLRRRPHRPLAISSGHVHRPMSSLLGGVPAHICGSICPANPLWFGGPDVPVVHEPPMIMVHRLVGRDLVNHHIAV